MKVLIIYPFYGGIGGISRYLENFMKYASLNKTITIYLLTNYEKKNFKLYKNIKLINVPMRKHNRFRLVLWSVKCRKIIKKMYNDKIVDLVNIHMPPLLHGIFLPEIPCVITLHSSAKLHESGKKVSVLEKKLRFILEKFILKKAKKIIVLTKSLRKELKVYDIDNKKIHIIPNGVDTEKFCKKIREKKFDVLFIGRLIKEKGSRDIPRICKLLINKNTSIKIAIVGNGPDFNYVKNELNNEIKSENIIMTSEINPEEVQNYYQLSKVYVSSSHYEGLPGTCLEAMSCGIPVIVWNKKFYDYVVNNNVGYLIKENDFVEMVRKINYLIKEDTKRNILGNNGRLHVIAHFKWSALSDYIINKLFEWRINTNE